MSINLQQRYVDQTGKPTPALMLLLQSYERDLAASRVRIAALEAKFTAIAAITAPTGGATVDAEARAAINAIIGAA